MQSRSSERWCQGLSRSAWEAAQREQGVRKPARPGPDDDLLPDDELGRPAWMGEGEQDDNQIDA